MIYFQLLMCGAVLAMAIYAYGLARELLLHRNNEKERKRAERNWLIQPDKLDTR